MTRIPTTGLTPPQLCARLKLGPGFQTPYTVVCFIFNDLRREATVHFIDYIQTLNTTNLKVY